jgi:hypothetical protein
VPFQQAMGLYLNLKGESLSFFFILGENFISKRKYLKIKISQLNMFQLRLHLVIVDPCEAQKNSKPSAFIG